ncbi:hypothetical protein F2Q68_00036643 [Brassica cretica]|uniref:Uncharacterized protein n=2 Tax=Brassica cretica TaxID=69181 RepID=A0A8S9H3V4_BRACR|nr:hypothetical protein F2Q68_00036643 [Brassica cretica]KAF3574652.1 hypothetical protein F2Q69_00062077 [Brassica cretica]
MKKKGNFQHSSFLAGGATLSAGGNSSRTQNQIYSNEHIEEYENPVPKEKIVKRIDSHKGIKSFRLAERLHSRWSTGRAYPRISCMRDYPLELQFRVLEQAQLSPRASSFSNPSPFSLARSLGTSLGRSHLVQELESL